MSDATRRPEQVEHLAQVNALSQAVRSAISAIEKNDLKRFEIQLSVQERICNQLSGAQWMLPAPGSEKAAEAEGFDAQFVLEIRQAYVTLAQLNLVYSSLLRRTRRSFGLIAALYRGHGVGYDRGAALPPQHRTWECEV